MHITWIGQAGLLIRTGRHIILIDPYLSDSVGDANPSMHRRVPVDEALFHLQPDLILCTHSHMDHMDLPTLEHWLKNDRGILFLGPRSVWEALKPYGGSHNYVLFNKGSSWSIEGLRLTAVRAEHSDPCAIGVLLEDEEEVVYVTGDTLYNRYIFPQLPKQIDRIFLPVNGVGNNMNYADAAHFASDSGAKIAVPVHWGLMDDLDAADWQYEPKYVPTIYQPIE